MSSPEVTITLGRSGQVVTKGGKRSRGEGYESNGDSFLSSANKRYRGNGMKWSPIIDGVDGSQIAHNDLRLKLMHKRQSKKIHNVVEEQGKIKPRKKLVTETQPPISSVNSYMLPHGPEPNGSKFSRKILHREIAEGLRQVDSLGKFYPYHTMEVSRARSPHEIQKSYSRPSPTRKFDEIQKVTPMRTADVSRAGQFLSDEVVDASRLRRAPHVIMKATSQAGNLVTRVAPTSGIMQAVSHLGEEPQTVAHFLHSLGLGKYVVNFQAEEVDMTILKQMGDKDLKEMGIPMGPRKKILLALMARMKWQTSRVQH
ncbi:uncharacterized protein LOC8280587 isoform X1 [Ricinus communis]|uniref:uncharacterized protein LOC8280587 isoform X1 n=1 Tax=Ricinus communis TaxID=3988 RepID=UPI000772689D|nr:uncharacterized protein LOC8280587 isoform X1 [Ricinus communis]|eukprot:XP_015573727.1 uncharacterized protein LOC8280587 isoform X1 [Ricinus communis]